MLESSTEEAALRTADEHLFLCGVGDVAEELCRANMRWGLARIQHAESQLGLPPPRACFIGAPDATVTRNSRRWAAGFGYGGLVCWHPDLFVLDAKPNGCGMLLGALETAPVEEEVRAAAARARDLSPVLDGVELRYDLGESNHFVDVLELDEVMVSDRPSPPPRHLFVIHSSGHEHRSASPLGPGLYLDESETLRKLATRLDTPWGPVHVLFGEQAQSFHTFCADVQRFNARRRSLYAGLLFGRYHDLGNHTHQGVRAPGELLLGAYHAKPAELFPLTLGPDQPVFLIQPRPSFSPEIVKRMGWAERALRSGLDGRLGRANLLPHGGGYSFPLLQRLLSVEISGATRAFHLQAASSSTPIVVDDVRQLPFGFRGEEVLRRLIELELGEAIARYRIKFVIK